MNKELLITLIKKDVKELEILTGSFEQMQEIPSMLLNLALDKVTALSSNLLALGGVASSAQVDSKIENKEMDSESVSGLCDELYDTELLLDSEDEVSTAISEADTEIIAPELIDLDEELVEAVPQEVEERIAEESVPLEEPTITIEEQTVPIIKEAVEVANPVINETEPAEIPELKAEVLSGPIVDEDKEDDEAIATSMEEEEEEDAAADIEAPQEHLEMEVPSDLYASAPDVELKEAASIAHSINAFVPSEPIESPLQVSPNSELKEKDHCVVEADNSVTCIADTINKSDSVAQILSSGDDTSVGNSMRKQPISDLKSAITIVDRFRFQRELFGVMVSE